MWWHLHAPSPVAFQVAGFSVRWYGIFVLFGFLAACFLLWRTRHRYPEVLRVWKIENSYFDTVSAFVPVFLIGVFGARIYEVLVVSFSYYRTHPTEVLSIWHGGLAVHGGLIAGGVLVWFKSRGCILRTLDWLAPAFALGQSIGRWGNYFNQELYGAPSVAWYSIFIDPVHRIAGYEASGNFIPVFLYESFALGCLAFVLWYLGKKEKREGVIAAWYLIGAGMIRFILEWWKIDPVSIVFGLRLPQVVALGMVVIGFGLIGYIQKLRTR